MTIVEQRAIELLEIESSQRQHFDVLQNENNNYNAYARRVNDSFKQLGCTLTQDGNEWCCLYGENLQVGVAGFGETPAAAITDWAKNFGI